MMMKIEYAFQLTLDDFLFMQTRLEDYNVR